MPPDKCGLLFLSAEFFKINFFRTIISGTLSEFQTVWKLVFHRNLKTEFSQVLSFLSVTVQISFDAHFGLKHHSNGIYNKPAHS